MVSEIQLRLAVIIYDILCSASYVLVIHLRPTRALPHQPIDRNNPLTIKERCQRASVLTATHVLLLPILLKVLRLSEIAETTAKLGIVVGYHNQSWSFSNLQDDIVSIFKALGLTMILFSGPIVDYFYYSNSTEVIKQDLAYVVSLEGMRDLLVGPITEELLYRSCSISLMLVANDYANKFLFGQHWLIMVSSLYFGIAHLHHAVELYHCKRYSLTTITISTAFQWSYTTLFGIYASFLYLRTGSVWSAIVVHSFCNMMGFPRLTFGRDEARDWKVGYYVLLALGSVLFKKFLYSLTESNHTLLL
ncbi:CAAX prenyl protease 2 involved in a-factor maturation [Komagataella phaffii CBS 7435]|uniref:intramembrane prenyl-peptidase Rce1 n=2 Tax=Komagataella phaffii TaxID=460519 RepID=C4R929_KOMPG|nr:Hypothetical protein PAS_chr4_0834 [Komagataella phaffii GS115]AOA64666.1 GQ67_05228T0 [Komagataella phaffii]CAH2450486.1 CAAX prenyl protease 2 involved in a-factor maturation [Komagataella phaffii CBS 7435]AOA70161.1 GQ68_05210T0 [Komagataella phaffii GS115]CAY72104.1 Hypothetical protein PAS_chr4_0834 [Komagataella phaffii GS115]CCA40292.1 CAAX prenyl protease 2 involved in a-factor maturation [Komagataella phaffii CBS 7435]